jgi:hypothetical protein
MSPSGVTVPNQNYLSSSEIGVNAGIEDGDRTCLNQLDVRNLIVVSNSQIVEEHLFYVPVQDLTISNQRSKQSILKCISWLNELTVRFLEVNIWIF